MCCLPLANRQPGQALQRADVEYGQSKRFELDRLGHVDLDPADGVDELLELREVDERDVVDSRPVSSLTVCSASVGPPNWKAALILFVP